MSEDNNDPIFEINRSQSPSVNSQTYAIPISDEMLEELSDGSSLQGSDESNESENDVRNDDVFLDSIVPETSNAFLQEYQDPGSMFDVSKYIFESLQQAIDSADFSEAVSLQTKTSAIINSKSLELKQLIQTTRVRLQQLKERLQQGAHTSKIVKQNLQQSMDRINIINGIIGTEYPIEFNQAREKIMERQFDDSFS